MARIQDNDHEPSMEEILASIRRIITDDTPPLAPDEAMPRPEPVTIEAKASRPPVLELTEAASEPETLVSEETMSASAQSISQLESLVVRDYPGSERTLDGLVREMLKPMLQQWLDAHLPELVERLVSREVRRITGRS